MSSLYLYFALILLWIAVAEGNTRACVGTTYCDINTAPYTYNGVPYCCPDGSRGITMGSSLTDVYCTSSTSQTCTPLTTYSWQVGSWGTCSVSCTQSRSVWCQSSQGSTVDDSFCSSSKPSTSQSCIGDSCRPDDACLTSHYSCLTCATDSKCGWCEVEGKCRTGTASGPSYSTCGSGWTFSSSNCASTAPNYSWKYDSWSTCSSSCTQSRNVWCQSLYNGATVNEQKCVEYVRPAQSQSCSGDSCTSGGSNTSGSSSSSGSVSGTYGSMSTSVIVGAVLSGVCGVISIMESW